MRSPGRARRARPRRRRGDRRGGRRAGQRRGRGAVGGAVGGRGRTTARSARAAGAAAAARAWSCPANPPATSAAASAARRPSPPRGASDGRAARAVDEMPIEGTLRTRLDATASAPKDQHKKAPARRGAWPGSDRLWTASARARPGGDRSAGAIGSMPGRSGDRSADAIGSVPGRSGDDHEHTNRNPANLHPAHPVFFAVRRPRLPPAATSSSPAPQFHKGGHGVRDRAQRRFERALAPA